MSTAFRYNLRLVSASGCSALARSCLAYRLITTKAWNEFITSKVVSSDPQPGFQHHNSPVGQRDLPVSWTWQRQWIEQTLRSSPRSTLDMAKEHFLHVTRSHDVGKIASAYATYRNAVQESLETDDTTHQYMDGHIRVGHVVGVLAVYEELSALDSTIAVDLVSRISSDLDAIWLDRVLCDKPNDLRNLVGRLLRIGKLDLAEALLTQCSTSDLHAEVEGSNHWLRVIAKHIQAQSPPEKLSNILQHLSSLSIRLQTRGYNMILQYFLEDCHPLPNEALAKCLKIMTDCGVEFDNTTKCHCLVWYLKQELYEDARKLAEQLKQSRETLMSPRGRNAVALYEAICGRRDIAWHHMDNLRRSGLPASEALLSVVFSPAVKGSSMTDVVNYAHKLLSQSRLSRFSATIYWAAIQRILSKSNISPEDRVDYAIHLFKAAKQRISAADHISLALPIITCLLPLHEILAPIISISSRRMAQAAAVYDGLDPAARSDIIRYIRAGTHCLRHFMLFFGKAGDLKRLRSVYLHCQLYSVPLANADMEGVFPYILRHVTTHEDAVEHYEHLRAFHKHGNNYACARLILESSWSLAEYPSASVFHRLVDGQTDENARDRLLRLLFRRYINFLRHNRGPVNTEILPGHKEVIGANLRQLRDQLPEKITTQEDAVRYSQAMTIYFSTGQFDEGMALWPDIRQACGYAPMVVALVLDGCGVNGRYANAEELWMEVRRHKEPNENEWAAWLECLAKLSEETFKRATHILLFDMGSDGKVDGTPPANADFATIILKYSTRYDLLEESIALIRQNLPGIWSQLMKRRMLRGPAAEAPRPDSYLSADPDALDRWASDPDDLPVV